ncbi:hypothetical protein DTL42_14190 [Bremerella cremea]|uniref:Uncharacterized protein n=1 Tax=Bremerella cremea TaxID=1031537 RepID=A0A368KRZ7_9BACT|nr:hypothetical protein [Bremerella cremea]RCS47665.1 hypothetical protein DTL42_14190 [Bremerella cremea]
MGWTYPNGVNRKQLIAQRVEGWERDNGEIQVKSTCLKHCYRGGVFSGVLWSVWERTFTKNGEEAQPSERWIQCDLLRCDRGEWGYKDIEESMGPYYFSCPLGYLELVPFDRYGGNAEWREQVIEHHRRRAEKRQCRAIIV